MSLVWGDASYKDRAFWSSCLWSAHFGHPFYMLRCNLGFVATTGSCRTRVQEIGLIWQYPLCLFFIAVTLRSLCNLILREACYWVLDQAPLICYLILLNSKCVFSVCVGSLSYGESLVS